MENARRALRTYITFPQLHRYICPARRGCALDVLLAFETWQDADAMRALYPMNTLRNWARLQVGCGAVGAGRCVPGCGCVWVRGHGPAVRLGLPAGHECGASTVYRQTAKPKPPNGTHGHPINTLLSVLIPMRVRHGG